MEITAYCDGSGKGFVCATFDYGEGYQRLHLGATSDSIFHEYRAILFAVKLMDPRHSYVLYNDNMGAIRHVTGEKAPPTNIIQHLVQEIWKATEHIDVKFCWIPRRDNYAGVMLDTGARDVYNREVLKGNIDASERINKKQYPYAHWPPEKKGVPRMHWAKCQRCKNGRIVEEVCDVCGFIPSSGKIRM